MNSRQFWRTIKSRISLLPVLNLLRRLNRWLKRLRLNNKPKNKPKAKAKSNNLLRFSFLPLIVVLISIPLFVLINFFRLQPQPSSLDWDADERPQIVGEQMNLMLLVYEKGDKYSFVDALGLLRINFATNESSLMLINPRLAVNTFEDRRYTQIEAILGRSALNNESPLGNLENEVQDILGLSVDRYLAISRDNLLTLLDVGKISLVSEEAVNNANVNIPEYKSLAGEELLAYLAANKSQDSNKQQARMQTTLTSQERAVLNWPTLIRYFLNVEQINQLIETNLSRDELVDVVTELLRNPNLQGDFIPMQNTYYIETSVGDYYVPNTAKVDEQVKKLLASREIIQEQARIEIYNATNINGLASQYGRSLNNLGANVIRAGNYPDLESSNRLYVPDQQQKYYHNIDVIEQVLQGDVTIVDEPYPYNHTAELVLVLGSKDKKDK